LWSSSIKSPVKAKPANRTFLRTLLYFEYIVLLKMLQKCRSFLFIFWHCTFIEFTTLTILTFLTDPLHELASWGVYLKMPIFSIFDFKDNFLEWPNM
jgi:hypothetical protein